MGEYKSGLAFLFLMTVVLLSLAASVTVVEWIIVGKLAPIGLFPLRGTK
jgi:hypothetical protein